MLRRLRTERSSSKGSRRSHSAERTNSNSPDGDDHHSSSSSSGRSNGSGHVRTLSEPMTEEALQALSLQGGMAAAPWTISRHSGGTKERNCWSETPGESFKVRGPDYLRGDKKKVESRSNHLRARGVDLFMTDTFGPMNVGRNPKILSGTIRDVPTFIINFRFPWGLLVLYLEISNTFLPFIRERYSKSDFPPEDKVYTLRSPAERALAKFFLGDDEYRNSSLKLIPVVVEGPWVVTSLVTGKPTIIGNKLPVKYIYEPPDVDRGYAEYLEADLDIGSGSKTAKHIVSMLKRYMSAVTVDVGLVIEGKSNEELPEQMVGAFRLHKFDVSKAPLLDVRGMENA